MKQHALAALVGLALLASHGVAQNTLFVANDLSGPVREFTKAGVFVQDWGMPGTVGPAIDPAGFVYSTRPNSPTSLIDRYDVNNVFQNTIEFTDFSDPGGNGFPGWIEDLAYAGNGMLWVGAFSGVVYLIDSTGAIQLQFFTNTTFTGIATDGAVLYTSRGFNGDGTFDIWDLSGNPMGTIPTAFHDSGGLGWDSDDNTLWAGYRGGVIRHFAIDGTLLGELNTGLNFHDGLEVGNPRGGAECFTLDFETDDEGQLLVHGQHLGNGDPEFDGGASFPVTITSSVNASNLPTAAVLDSDTGPAAQDPDLLVGRGNILILQTDANLSECPPASGIYCSHNDDENGGTLSFAFPGPTTPSSVVLIDIDSTDGTSTVVLTDGAGAQRTYTVPANWTGDFMSDGPPGWKLLDLTDTNGQIGFGSTATAVDDAGFDPTGVLQIDIHLAHSGGVDDLSWCETSVAVQPSVQPRNGSGVNHVILSSASLPLIGGTWAANLDCQGFGSGLATLTVCRRATSGTMTPFGEQLIAGALFLRSGQVFAGSVSQFTWAIPNDSALVGLDLYAQGLCWSTQGLLGPKTMRARKGLSNALDLILGF